MRYRAQPSIASRSGGLLDPARAFSRGVAKPLVACIILSIEWTESCIAWNDIQLVSYYSDHDLVWTDLLAVISIKT